MMRTIVVGDGPMGRAVETALRERGTPAVSVLGRPAHAGGHPPTAFAGAELVFDFSRGTAVRSNVEAAIGWGVPALVIGTTAWDADRDAVTHLVQSAGAAAVAAPNFSIGHAIFASLVETAASLFGPHIAYDPLIVEWHRRSKADRPSGTAKELSRRILAAHPRKQRLADPTSARAPASDELEVSVVRAGSSPGMHQVAFDAPGETIELRITARDRSAYAAGALAAALWLLAEPRQPGLHTFDEVLADQEGTI
jgi:4-hydroxy-tetrahydrodipicolinate reductase